MATFLRVVKQMACPDSIRCQCFQHGKLSLSSIVLFHYEWGFKNLPSYIVSRLLGKFYNASEEDIFYFCFFSENVDAKRIERQEAVEIFISNSAKIKL